MNGGVQGKAAEEDRLGKGGGIKPMRCFYTSCNNKLSSKCVKETYAVAGGCTGIQGLALSLLPRVTRATKLQQCTPAAAANQCRLVSQHI